MVDTLWRLTRMSHSLFLVDDVDLLEGYLDPDRNAQVQRSILSDALTELHKTPCVDVVLTARSWYAHSRKEFQTLVDLARAEEISTEDLIEIHDKRFKVFVGNKLPQQFLSRSALEKAASDVNGMPGVFLQHLDTAFRVYQTEDDWGERDYEWYVDVFRKLYSQFRAKCPAAAEAIEAAVKKGQLTIDVRRGNPFNQTIFDNEFVFQSYYQETTYFTDSLVQKVVQRTE